MSSEKIRASTSISDLPDNDFSTQRIIDEINVNDSSDTEDNGIEDISDSIENVDFLNKKNDTLLNFVVNNGLDFLLVFGIVFLVLNRDFMRLISRTSLFSRIDTGSMIFSGAVGLLAGVIFLIIKFISM
ncbi:MAG TPA: hypothetical protein V6C58_14020 [Allocoleopsis sp.]